MAVKCRVGKDTIHEWGDIIIETKRYLPNSISLTSFLGLFIPRYHHHI